VAQPADLRALLLADWDRVIAPGPDLSFQPVRRMTSLASLELKSSMKPASWSASRTRHSGGSLWGARSWDPAPGTPGLCNRFKQELPYGQLFKS